MLRKTVKRQSAIIEILQDTLKRLLSDNMRNQIKTAFDVVWNKHPQNPDKPKPAQQSRYDGPSGP